MKTRYLVLFAALAAVTNSSFADAGHDFPSALRAEPASSSQTLSLRSAQATQIQAPPEGKTRAQAMQELIEAQRAGLVPTSRSDYPPSEATIERNRARYGSDSGRTAGH